MRRVGFLINPIAGMGGRVGLKGTDGVVDEARRRGAEPRSSDRAADALEALFERESDIELVTCGDPMGESVSRQVGFEPIIVYEPQSEQTDARDTQSAVRAFIDASVDIILFAGGDGTGVDIVEVLEESDAETPILGIPAGVKVYSSVFAVTPRAAGRIIAGYDDVEQREVNDIDEDAYRAGEVRSVTKGVVAVPVANEVQSSKQLASGTVEALVAGVVDDMRSDATYILGPGGTMLAIKRALGFDGSPLGVDVWRDGEVIVRDGAANDILDALSDENVIIVSPIGGQGFIFGRGNQQISPEIINQSSIEVVASPSKLDTIGVLRVDTGDDAIDEKLRGWLKVRIGRFERRMMQVK